MGKNSYFKDEDSEYDKMYITDVTLFFGVKFLFELNLFLSVITVTFKFVNVSRIYGDFLIFHLITMAER